MRRREFITLLGGMAVAWPIEARAQEPARIKRIGVLLASADDDLDTQAHAAVFVQQLQQSGWIDGRNIRLEIRWGAGNATDTNKYAAELLALAPDVIFVTGGVPLASLLRATRTVPIVFAIVPDPVGSGFVDSLSRPGGNATGFMQFEYTLSAKWPELLKEMAPGVTRVVILRDPDITAGIGQFAVIQSVAPALGMEVSPVSLRNVSEIERGIAAVARYGNGGLILTASALSSVNRDLIVSLAARHRLPTMLLSKGLRNQRWPALLWSRLRADQYRRAAGYVDRILNGGNLADLPVQSPTKYDVDYQSQDRESTWRRSCPRHC